MGVAYLSHGLERISLSFNHWLSGETSHVGCFAEPLQRTSTSRTLIFFSLFVPSPVEFPHGNDGVSALLYMHGFQFNLYALHHAHHLIKPACLLVFLCLNAKCACWSKLHCTNDCKPSPGARILKTALCTNDGDDELHDEYLISFGLAQVTVFICKTMRLQKL